MPALRKLPTVNGAFLNRIETAVPPHDVHRTFVAYA